MRLSVGNMHLILYFNMWLPFCSPVCLVCLVCRVCCCRCVCAVCRCAGVSVGAQVYGADKYYQKRGEQMAHVPKDMDFANQLIRQLVEQLEDAEKSVTEMRVYMSSAAMIASQCCGEPLCCVRCDFLCVVCCTTVVCAGVCAVARHFLCVASPRGLSVCGLLRSCCLCACVLWRDIVCVLYVVSLCVQSVVQLLSLSVCAAEGMTHFCVVYVCVLAVFCSERVIACTRSLCGISVV